MARGRIDLPNLDDRTWQDLVNQTKALIPKYAPEWTDHNPSDLGITLIELFAWLVEQMIYRLNRVPEKNYIAFLNLLGITRDPAIPASTYLTFRVHTNKDVVTIAKGSQASTQPKAGEAMIVFETDEKVDILPINLEIVLYPTPDQEVLGRMTGCLAGKTVQLKAGSDNGDLGSIYLGFDGKTTRPIDLCCRFTQSLLADNPQITWKYSTKNNEWKKLEAGVIRDETNGFKKNGTASLTIPAEDWDKQKVDTAELYWIRATIASSASCTLGVEHLLFNSVPATSALTITDELLGTSNGMANQMFELHHRPVFKDLQNTEGVHLDSYLTLEVDGQSDWRRVEDMPEDQECRCFRLEPVTGTVYFGDGTHGKIPDKESKIVAQCYRYVANDSRGNVAPNMVTVLYGPAQLKQNGVIGVTNLLVGKGGEPEESIEDTKRRAPELLRNRYRAVTLEDYEYLAREAPLRVKKVRALGPRFCPASEENEICETQGAPWNYGGLCRDAGHVYVIVIPNVEQATSLEEVMPLPDELLLKQIQAYLDERRTLTTKLTVTGPRYLPIDVTLTFKVWQQAIDDGLLPNVDEAGGKAEFIQDMKGRIRQFLHPLWGGPKETGWEIGENISVASLLQFIQPPPAIGYIESIKIVPGLNKERSAENRFYNPPVRPYEPIDSDPGVWVRVADYEIVCCGQLTVNADVVPVGN